MAACPTSDIAVLEKAGSLGEHSLSGAVVNPRAMRELFPDRAPSDFPFRQPVAGEAVYFLTEGRAQRLPTPPTMHNAGYYTASLCEIVRWLGERAEELGVNLFAGFPVDALLVEAIGGARRTDHARPDSTRTAAAPAELHRADGAHRADHRAGRRHPRTADPGLAPWQQVSSPNPRSSPWA